MSMVEAVPHAGNYGSPFPPAGDAFVYRRDASEPNGVHAHVRSVIDGYDFRPFALGGAATSVQYTLQRTGGMVLSLDRPTWESWLRELGVFVDYPRPRLRTALGAQIDEIQRLTGLVDGQLAVAFPGGVARETVNRWRNGSDSNVRPENAYRLGLLLDLARRVESAGIDARVWLHQAAQNGTSTPFELLCAGRLGDVRQAVEIVAAGAASPTAPARIPETRRDWGGVDEDQEGDLADDDGWTRGEWGQDAGT